MRPRILAAAVAITATFSLVSCAAGYDEATKDNLRERVVAVAEASAAGDWQAAQNGLDVMAAELSDARSEGKVSEERFDTIVMAMELVRQDIDAAIAAAADAAEQQQLLEEQARLQEQIAQLQEQQNQGNVDANQGNVDNTGEEGKSGEEGNSGEHDKSGEADKKGDEEKNE
jgi:predicted secreted protein